MALPPRRKDFANLASPVSLANQNVSRKTEDLATGRFNTTHWSVVLACSGENDTRQAHEALAKLFQTYWYPLYAYTRRRGYGEQDAQDLVQAFCVHLQEKHALAKADPQRGRFRTFLLSSLQNFLANEKARAHAQKRGGGREQVFVSRGAARH